MEPLPIIVVHCGKSQALDLTLRQAHKTNPESRLILLGDEATQHPDFVEFHCIYEPELYRGVDFFYSIYQHLSSSSLPKFEKFCMARWLILRNFMHQEGLTRCLAIDSDVLVFCNVSEEAKRFSSYAMTFAHWNETQNLIHCNFILDRAALDSFAEYLLAVYQDPELLERAIKAGCKRKGKYRVSDMSHFYDWSIHTNFPFCFFEDFYKDGIFFDSCIDFWGGFQSFSWFPKVFRRIKHVAWKDGLPYVTLIDGRSMPAKVLHYHGAQKFLMDYHVQGKAPFWGIFFCFLKDKVRKIPEKIQNAVRRCIYRGGNWG